VKIAFQVTLNVRCTSLNVQCTVLEKKKGSTSNVPKVIWNV